MHSVEITRRSNMMKLVVSVLAVLALSSPMYAYTIPHTGDGALANELQQFIDLVPLDNIVDIALEYLSKDREVQLVAEYLQDTEFKNLLTDIEAMPEVVDLLNYIQDAGVDIYYIVNKVNDYLGLAPMQPPANLLKITGGIRGLLDDIEAILPFDELKALYRKKLDTSPVFKDLVDRLSSPATQKIVDQVCSNPNFRGLLAKAKNAGLDVQAVRKALENVLGLTVPCRA